MAAELGRRARAAGKEGDALRVLGAEVRDAKADLVAPKVGGRPEGPHQAGAPWAPPRGEAGRDPGGRNAGMVTAQASRR